MKEIVKLFSEWGQLKMVEHVGFKLVGVKHPESVAEHSLRAAQIAFVLACLEGYKNPHEVASMLVFHDIGECRIGDLHKVATRYGRLDEKGAVKEQLIRAGECGKEIFRLWNEAEERTTIAGIIAKDSDYLEQALCAKEYFELGYLGAEDWIINVGKALKTKSAKKLWKEIRKANVYGSGKGSWWDGLKKLGK